MWGNLLNQAQWPDPSVHVTTITNSPNVQDSSRKLGDGQKGNKQADASHCDLIVPFQGLCNLRLFKLFFSNIVIIMMISYRDHSLNQHHFVIIQVVNDEFANLEAAFIYLRGH